MCRKSITRFPSRNFYHEFGVQKRGPRGGSFLAGVSPPSGGGGTPPGGGPGPPPGGRPPHGGEGGVPPLPPSRGGWGGSPGTPKKGFSGPPPGGVILRPKWSQPRVNTDGRTIKIRKVSIWGVHLGENLSIFGAHSFRKTHHGSSRF